MPVRPVPIRVTVSVPDDLHRAIQSARGFLLQGFSTDFAYSAILETLARAGVAYYASYPWPKGDINEVGGSDEEKAKLRQQVGQVWQQHVDSSAYSDFLSQTELPLSLLVEVMMERLAKPRRTGKRTRLAGTGLDLTEILGEKEPQSKK